MAWHELLGWIGAASYLLAYLMLSLGKWRAATYRFHSLNALGAAGLIVNSLYTNDLPSVVVNLAWLAIAAISLLRLALLERKD